MALAGLSGDEQCIIFSQLCNVLDTRIAVAFSSTSSELRALTPTLRQQLRADHEVAAALCHKLGLRSCKALREAKRGVWSNNGLSATDLATLGTLGSVLPALETLNLSHTQVTDAGCAALAAALGSGALPALDNLNLRDTRLAGAASPRPSDPPSRPLQLVCDAEPSLTRSQHRCRRHYHRHLP